METEVEYEGSDKIVAEGSSSIEGILSKVREKVLEHLAAAKYDTEIYSSVEIDLFFEFHKAVKQ